jgi:hypothetical protein
VSGEVDSDCAADAAASAGYKCDLVFQVHVEMPARTTERLALAPQEPNP